MHSTRVNQQLATIGPGPTVLLCLLCSAALAGPATAQSAKTDEVSTAELLRRLEELERNQAEMQRELDQREEQVERLIRRRSEREAQRADVVGDQEGIVGADDVQPPGAPAEAIGPDGENDYFGVFQTGGRGFKVADTPSGDLNISLWAYIRYLNQKGLDETYTDAFGRSFELDLRNDVQVNKVNIYFKGWLFDPRFRYQAFVWTANTSQGDPAQVVVAGALSYRFRQWLDVGAGIGALPGTRTLIGTFPYWNKVDTRPMADEFFRPSYTTGIWAQGALTEGLMYKFMVGNNLSQLGVSASQLDNDFNTVSAAIWWMPTTGEYGPAGGFGDFEHHEELATTVGLHVTRSREDKQSQPDTEDIQNSQIRLSDGTILFTPDAFDTDGSILRATYLMSSVDAGMKYRGLSLDGEYYFRWVDDFDTVGSIPVEDLFDHGFQLQASAMLMPKSLQGYIAASKIYGEYGDPYDFSVGLNWFPLQERLFRLNTEVLYLKNSPVGYSSVPFAVGGNGTVFHANLEVYF